MNKDHGGNRRSRLFGLLRAFRNAAAVLPDALVAVDHAQHILWFNTAAARLLGLVRPLDVGAHLPSVLSINGLSDWIASGGTEALEDVVAPNNAQVHLSLHLIPYDADHSLLLARDISQLLRLEKMRRDFVANVSHELRTPLTVVHGYLDLIEPEELPEYAPILRELRSQSRRMTQIVEDLLTLSRLDAEDALPETRVPMRPLLTTLHRDAQGLSRGRHEITLEINSSHDLCGSSRDLYSAFSNLVSNAVRHTPPGGIISIAWISDTSGGRLSVQDTGHGIPAQHLPRLTERFYRVSTSRSRDSGGTGLGLSIVKHVLQLHDAHLDISSKLGSGSTFTCVFGPGRLLRAESSAREIQ